VRKENPEMPPLEKFVDVDLSPLNLIKKIAGERIRQERKLRLITQIELAENMGISPRWLREMETGARSARLDDHISATLHLGQSLAHIGLPLLCMGHGIRFPPQLLPGDLDAIERKCIGFIVDSAVDALKHDLSPKWWPSSGAE
jgi:transcriptional regulator with XRE-family HTH domain